MKTDTSQKLRILSLLRLLYKKTDDTHSLTLAEIEAHLEKEGCVAERKTLYRDFAQLKEFGFDINKVKSGRTYYYSLATREFELPEIKLLIDCVQSAKFMTAKKSKILISKLESLTSDFEAKKLHRHVTIADRVRTDNEKIYYNLDGIHGAINANKQLTFQYFYWTAHKKRELKRNGKVYVISPWHLILNDGNYYMVGYDEEADTIKHFRVDKMIHIEVTGKKRLGREKFKGFSAADYAKSHFAMMSGEIEIVTLECENEMANVIIDKFGQDVNMHPTDSHHFTANVEVAPEGQFLGWIIGLSGKVKIAGPKKVRDQMKIIASSILSDYS